MWTRNSDITSDKWPENRNSNKHRGHVDAGPRNESPKILYCYFWILMLMLMSMSMEMRSYNQSLLGRVGWNL